MRIHTAAVCLLVDGITCHRLTHHPPTHPPPIDSIRDITAVAKNYLKIQQCQLGGRISYKTIAT